MTMQVPQFDGVVTPAADVAVDMLFVPVFQDDADQALAGIPGLETAVGGWLAEVRASGEFRSKRYEFFILPAVAGWKWVWMTSRRRRWPRPSMPRMASVNVPESR